jgi:uncharacterized protein YeaO (DUF488 family)
VKAVIIKKANSLIEEQEQISKKGQEIVEMNDKFSKDQEEFKKMAENITKETKQEDIKKLKDIQDLLKKDHENLVQTDKAYREAVNSLN